MLHAHTSTPTRATTIDPAAGRIVNVGPLEGGAGQVFNFEWQFGEGNRYRTFSLGFTEPWLYGSPTTFGVSLFDTRQIYTYDLRQTGVSTRIGRRSASG